MTYGKSQVIDLVESDDDNDNSSSAATASTSRGAQQAQAGNPARSYLAGLNDAQLEAVTWSSKGGLQILAGPGSGKTRVLTSRVAYLIQECAIRPQDLVVVTFTNKAANEMRHRLRLLLGEERVNKIMMGTFHSVAVRYLRKYGKAIELPTNFVIADQSDSQSILKPIVAQHNQAFKTRNKDQNRSQDASQTDEIKVKTAQDAISRAKAKGISEELYMAEAEQAEGHNSWKLTIADIYIDYQQALRASNTLDFDDLLVYTERLLEKLPSCVAGIKHVLVDEFQDTNSIQYNIVRLMARASSSLTVVGDPDQSIYAWRSADVENLEHMLGHFKKTKQVMLEENYRSTSSILNAALAVVQQDKERIQKSLRTSHPTGPPVALRNFQTVQDEAAYIAYEIKRTIAHSGNVLDYNDFAVLLRYNALSRSIEGALQTAGIPSRMIGGHKFFDRAEVKDFLAYLQLADNPSYAPAFRRIINVPKRGIGDKTVKDIEKAARDRGISAYEVVQKALRGNPIVDIKPGQKANLRTFCDVMKTLKAKAAAGDSVEILIDYLATAISYKEHLERTSGVEHVSRMENINELKTFAEQISGSIQLTTAEEGQQAEQLVIDLDAEPTVEGDTATTPLRTFLAASMLSTDTETQDAKDDKTTSKVTISTCHAAKGLEWPVVFLPAAETGVYPAFRKHEAAEVAEERRLFYVAMTRAQALLHITHTSRRMERGQTEDKSLTAFLEPLSRNKDVPFAGVDLVLNGETLACISAVTKRSTASESDIQASTRAFYDSVTAPVYTAAEAFKPAYPAYSRQDVHLYPSKPVRPGEAWRLNSYAGDQARRYAAQLPNSGVNRFAGAFSTATNVASSSQAPGFTSALTASGIGNPLATSKTPSFSGSTAPGLKASTSAPAPSRPFSSTTVNKPFKVPTMIKPGSLPTVNTVETRLTQQHQAVIFNPVAPKEPTSRPYTLPSNRNEDFEFLKGLARDENDDYAPRRASGPKRTSDALFAGMASKKGRQ